MPRKAPAPISELPPTLTPGVEGGELPDPSVVPDQHTSREDRLLAHLGLGADHRQRPDRGARGDARGAGDVSPGVDHAPGGPAGIGEPPPVGLPIASEAEHGPGPGRRLLEGDDLDPVDRRPGLLGALEGDQPLDLDSARRPPIPRPRPRTSRFRLCGGRPPREQQPQISISAASSSWRASSPSGQRKTRSSPASA